MVPMHPLSIYFWISIPRVVEGNYLGGRFQEFVIFVVIVIVVVVVITFISDVIIYFLWFFLIRFHDDGRRGRLWSGCEGQFIVRSWVMLLLILRKIFLPLSRLVEDVEQAHNHDHSNPNAEKR